MSNNISENFNAECAKGYVLANPGQAPERTVEVEHFERNDPVSVIQRAIGADDDGMWGGQTNEAFTQWLRLQQAEVMGAENADGWLGPNTLRALEGHIDAETYNALKTLYEDGSYSKLHARDQWHSASLQEVEAACQPAAPAPVVDDTAPAAPVAPVATPDVPVAPQEVEPVVAQPAAPELEPAPEPDPEPAPVQPEPEPEPEPEPAPVEVAPPAAAPVTPELSASFAGDYEIMYAGVQMAYLDYIGNMPMAMSAEQSAFFHQANSQYDATQEAYRNGDKIGNVQLSHDFVTSMQDGLQQQELDFVKQNWDQLYPYFGHIGETVGPEDYERGLEVLKARQNDIVDATYDHRGAGVRELLRDRQAFNHLEQPLQSFAAQATAIETLAANNGITLNTPEVDPAAPDAAGPQPVQQQPGLAN